ncbi:hypothetical protein GCM10020295_44290 [Streptomyces cinereospinus]
MARRSRLDGLRGALRAIERIPQAMDAARTETLNEWADAVQNTAEDRVPRDKGDLWQALDQRVNTHFGRAEVGVWDPDQLEYAMYVEKGHLQDGRPAFPGARVQRAPPTGHPHLPRRVPPAHGRG